MAQPIDSHAIPTDDPSVAHSQRIEQDTRLEPLFLTSAQAATLLGLKPCTLAAWRCLRSDGPPFVRMSSAVRYNRITLLNWAQARTQQSTGSVRKEHGHD